MLLNNMLSVCMWNGVIPVSRPIRPKQRDNCTLSRFFWRFDFYIGDRDRCTRIWRKINFCSVPIHLYIIKYYQNMFIINGHDRHVYYY